MRQLLSRRAPSWRAGTSMRRLLRAFILLALTVAATTCDPAPPAVVGSVVGPVSFEAPAFDTGAVDGQQGWTSTGAVDHEVADVSASGSRPADLGLGTQSLRLSNADGEET